MNTKHTTSIQSVHTQPEGLFNQQSSKFLIRTKSPAMISYTSQLQSKHKQKNIKVQYNKQLQDNKHIISFNLEDQFTKNQIVERLTTDFQQQSTKLSNQKKIHLASPNYQTSSNNLASPNSHSLSQYFNDNSCKESQQTKKTRRLLTPNQPNPDNQTLECPEVFQNELVAKITERYNDALEKIELEYNKLQVMVAFMESYKVIGVRDKDLQKLREDLKQFQDQLQINLQKDKLRNDQFMKINVLNYKYQSQQLKYDNLKKKYEHLKEAHIDLKQKYEFKENQQIQLQKEMNQLQSKDIEQKKYIESLENRIKIVWSGQEANFQNSDNMRKTIAELIRENESYKRNLFTKNRAIVKHNEQKEVLKENVDKLQKQVLYWQKKLSKQTTEMNQENDLNILLNYRLPFNMEYRLDHLPSQHRLILLDIVLHGSQMFAEYVSVMEEPDQIKQAVNLVAEQFIEMQQFQQSVNSMLIELMDLMNIYDIQEFSLKLKEILEVKYETKQCYLWIPDQMTGNFMAHTKQGLKKMTMEGGLFEECFINMAPFQYSGESRTIYHEINKQVDIQNTLLIPIYHRTDHLLAIIEISNSGFTYGRDNEYLLLLLTMFTLQTFQRNIDHEIMVNYVNNQDQFIEFY